MTNNTQLNNGIAQKLTSVLLFVLGAIISTVIFFIAIDTSLNEAPIDFSEEVKIIETKANQTSSLIDLLTLKADFYFQVADTMWLSWGVLISCLLATVIFIIILNKRGEHSRISKIKFNLQQELRQRKALEIRLENTDAKMLESHENINDAFILVGSDMQLLHANKNAQSFFEVWAENIQQPDGHNLKDLIPDFQFSGFRKHLNECLEIDTAWEGELKVADEFLLIRIFPARTGVFVIFRDISHQQKSSNTLEVGQILLKHVTKNMNEPLAIVDLDWQYLVTSATWKEAFNLSQHKKLAGLSHGELLPEIPGNNTALINRIKQGKTLRTENIQHKINGKEESINWVISPWKDQFGKISGCMMQAEFITDKVQQKQRKDQEVRKEKMLAYHDMLTGLPNRQLFYDRLNVALANAYRNLTQISLMFLDLDGFKAVNDNLGHDVGDILLKEVSARLKNCVRESDTVARLGGDEFTVILTDINNNSNASDIADKILKAVSEPFQIGGNEVKIGVSIGISMYPADGSTTTELVKTADKAMYKAKESGKNCYFFYEMPDEAHKSE